MLPDRFETDRLILRPVAMPDARAIFEEYAQDEAVSRYLSWRPHDAIEQTEAYVAACLAAPTARTYAVLPRTTRAVIGTLDLRRT